MKPEGCRKLLELQAGMRRELSHLREELASHEVQLNDLVYSLYGVTPGEQKIIEGFPRPLLPRSAAQIEEDEPEQKASQGPANWSST